MEAPTNIYLTWHIKSDNTIFLDANNNPYLQFSYDELTKEKISSNGGYGIKLSANREVDNKITGYDIKLSFIDYLRFCIKWAGFPNLHWFQEELKDDSLFQKIKSMAH